MCCAICNFHLFTIFVLSAQKGEWQFRCLFGKLRKHQTIRTILFNSTAYNLEFRSDCQRLFHHGTIKINKLWDHEHVYKQRQFLLTWEIISPWYFSDLAYYVDWTCTYAVMKYRVCCFMEECSSANGDPEFLAFWILSSELWRSDRMDIANASYAIWPNVGHRRGEHFVRISTVCERMVSHESSERSILAQGKLE